MHEGLTIILTKKGGGTLEMLSKLKSKITEADLVEALCMLCIAANCIVAAYGFSTYAYDRAIIYTLFMFIAILTLLLYRSFSED